MATESTASTGESLRSARAAAPRGPGLRAAALLFLGIGAAAKAKVSRRQFLGAAMLLCGGLSAAACNHPAPCDPVECDPTVDPACPPSGFYCDDYTVAGGVG